VKSITSPIASLSLNPAIDLTYEIGCLQHDQKIRATSASYDPGGTGINVGRALEKLNANSFTCCITAGKMGEFLCSMLKQELSSVITLQIDGETRINTTLVQNNPPNQYEINAVGPYVTSAQLDSISSQFLTLCQGGIGVLTGSLPPGVPDTAYQSISAALLEQGTRSIIDAPVAVMKAALHSKPFLIKPNWHEMEILQNKTLATIEQVAEEARVLVKQGATYVCVSLAEKGALLTGETNTYYCNSPNIEVNSTVGAGDSLVAGLAYAFALNRGPEQALGFAVACGAGTAMQAGTQLFSKNDLEKLSKEIKIKVLDI